MTEHPVEDAVGHYKPEGTLHLMAGIVNAFPSRNVPSYFIVGFPLLDDAKVNYVAMAAKSGNKTMIVAVPTTGAAIPTEYDPSEFMGKDGVKYSKKAQLSVKLSDGGTGIVFEKEIFK